MLFITKAHLLFYIKEYAVSYTHLDVYKRQLIILPILVAVIIVLPQAFIIFIRVSRWFSFSFFSSLSS